MQCIHHPAEAATHDVDGRAVCTSCASDAAERSDAFASAIPVLVGVGYLAAIAIGYLVLRARPIVGALAAVVALVFARLLQHTVRPAVVTPRSAGHPSAER